ncbi:MAG: hypothetical protein FWC29_01255, partial [Methanomassiliicoccaceae archaeon]|nr:hypothetical protein [Methanomassiliicoccaceae archaeon]
GGGVYNRNNAVLNMAGGEVSYNTAYCGGGIYNAATLNFTAGMIACNTAKGADSKGSGGGVYTTYFSKMTAANGAVFSGNMAPTLRTENIGPADDIDGNSITDLQDYENKIGAVVLDTGVNFGQNALAYNNYDINYSGNSYAVFVDIEPDGTGTVTVADGSGSIGYGTLTADGFVYVPTGVGSITLSAAPGSGYDFKKFTIDGTLVSINSPTVVPIAGNMSVVAEFEPASLPPGGAVEYLITATADKGSAITPEGEVKVLEGSDKTFTFSAKPGYRITAVYVDGVEVSSGELASGKYTFFDVRSDHIISVASKVIYTPLVGGNNTEKQDGNEGKDPIGGGSTGNEGGKGGDGNGEWAVLNLICAVLAVFTGIIAVIGGKDRRRKEGDDDAKKNSEIDEGDRKRSKSAFLLRITAVILGIASVIIFFLTEDWTLPVTAMDEWTLLMFILFLAAVITALVSFRFDESPEDDEAGDQKKTWI